MDFDKARAWWFHRQQLDSSGDSQNSAAILQTTGWSRSVGGSSPYIALFSRGGVHRPQVDQDLADIEIHELPSARGCTYIVPKSDYALALKVGQGFSDESAMRTARNYLGVTDEEIGRLEQKVLQALRNGPLDPKQLKDAVGEASRNLGEEGKKRGQTSTLPLALGFLQSRGEIRRIPANGRIDQQRYRYALWAESPLKGLEMDRTEAFRHLAQRYLSWIGPAKIAHFQWFSGLGVRDSKDAVENCGAVELEGDSDWWAMPEQESSFREYQMPNEQEIALVCSVDPILLHKRDLQNLMRPEHKESRVVDEKGLLQVGSALQDLSNHAIMDRGAVIGIWEFDPEVQEIIWHCFDEPTEAIRTKIRETEAYISAELGDCRSFSLDSPASRAPKLKKIRELNQE